LKYFFSQVIQYRYLSWIFFSFLFK